MKQEQQRIAIAQACGWTFEKFNVRNPKGEHLTYVCGLGRDKETYNVENAKQAVKLGLIPDYLNDLNAMQEAEKVLTDEQWKAYVRHIISPLAYMADGISQAGARKLASSTACQRAEAFLKTLNLWKL